MVNTTSAKVGELINYTVTVTNKGPSKATNVTVDDKLSNLLEIQGEVEGYNVTTGVWNVGDLDVNETKTIVIVAKVIGNGTIPNNISVKSSEIDIDSSNNHAAADNLTAIPVVDLKVTKVVSTTSAKVGDIIKYTITVVNKGPSVATGVKVTEKLSKLVKLQGKVNGYSNDVWNVGTLKVNETKTLTLTVKVVAAGNIENNVAISADQEDVDNSNNKASSKKVKAVAKHKSNVKVKISFKDSKGKVLKNQKVTFTYAGKTYTAKTNSKGVATIKTTKVTSKVKGVVNLKQIIVDKKVYKSLKIKKIKYSATFKNSKGKAIVGKKVVFKFKGITYKVKTNKKGVASITLKNLKKGKYNIVAYYHSTYYKTTLVIKK